MAIARKPKVNSKKGETEQNETAIMQIIEQGGSAPKDKETKLSTVKNYQHPLKFPHDGKVWERLETARNGDGIKLPRNTWILQAIHEKLEREGY